MAHRRGMEELDVMMVPDDSSRGYILECDLGKYFFYTLYIYVYLIKCNVSFLCISEFPLDFIKCNVSFLCISEFLLDFIKCNVSFLYVLEYPNEFHDLHKDYLLAPEPLQIEENTSTSLLTRWRIQETSTQACPEITQQNEQHNPPPQFQVVPGTGIASHQRISCFIIQSIPMVEKLHQLKHSSKMILKKNSLSWSTARSLVSLLYF